MDKVKPYSLRIIAGAFLFLLVLTGEAQELKLNFKFPSGQKLYFSEVIGPTYYLLDSIELNDKKQVVFDVSNSPIGYYKLHFNDTNTVDIIINKEPKIEITFHDSVLQNGVEVKESVENMLLWNYKYYSRNVQQLQKQIIIQRSYLMPLDSLYRSLTDKLDTLDNLKRDYLLKLAEENPTTYFNRTVAAAQPPTPKEGQTLKQVHFQNIDFSDPTLIRSSVFTSAMMDYLQRYTEYSEDGFHESIDFMLAFANQDQQVYEFCLNFLLEVFNLVGPDVIFDYLVENYLLEGGCSDAEISDDFKDIAEGYRKLMPGNKAPEFKIQDTLRNEVSSLDLYTDSLNLLFFWSSQCGHCHEAIPELIKLTGLNVIAISLDTNEEDWLNYIDQYKLPFHHYSELKGWDGEVNKLFKAHKTPSYFLINNLGIITYKPKDISDLKKILLE